jgi:hypothetical protein
VAARLGIAGLITRSPPVTIGRPPPPPAAGRQPQAAQAAGAARSVEASVRSGRSGHRLPIPRCAPGWPGEAGANRGCLKLGMDGVRNAQRAPRAFGFRHDRSGPATCAQAPEDPRFAVVQAVLVPGAAVAQVASRGSKPRAAGSCFRRHWGATFKREETTRKRLRPLQLRHEGGARG